MRLLRAVLLIASLSALARPARADADAPLAPSKRRVALSLGFSHWFGATFGSPDGLKTPTVGIGVRPGVSYLEARLRYSVSFPELALPSGARSHVGFLSLEWLLCKELAVRSTRANLYAGPLGLVAHAGSATGGLGAVLGAQILLETRAPSRLGVGFFFEGREIFYRLREDTGTIFDHARRDGQMDLGLVAAVF